MLQRIKADIEISVLRIAYNADLDLLLRPVRFVQIRQHQSGQDGAQGQQQRHNQHLRHQLQSPLQLEEEIALAFPAHGSPKLSVRRRMSPSYT